MAIQHGPDRLKRKVHKVGAALQHLKSREGDPELGQVGDRLERCHGLEGGGVGRHTHFILVARGQLTVSSGQQGEVKVWVRLVEYLTQSPGHEHTRQVGMGELITVNGKFAVIQFLLTHHAAGLVEVARVGDRHAQEQARMELVLEVVDDATKLIIFKNLVSIPPEIGSINS